MNATCNTMFFSEYLTETFPHIEKPFSTLKWLKSLDVDTLNMLHSYMHNFETNTPQDEINDDEVCDMFTMVDMIIQLETGKNKDEKDYPENAMSLQYLFILTTMEGLRRKGVVLIKGNGKITDGSTKFKLTDSADFKLTDSADIAINKG